MLRQFAYQEPPSAHAAPQQLSRAQVASRMPPNADSGRRAHDRADLRYEAISKPKFKPSVDTGATSSKGRERPPNNFRQVMGPPPTPQHRQDRPMQQLSQAPPSNNVQRMHAFNRPTDRGRVVIPDDPVRRVTATPSQAHRRFAPPTPANALVTGLMTPSRNRAQLSSRNGGQRVPFIIGGQR